MENNSVLFKLEEWLKDMGLPYISQLGAMLITLTVFLLLIFLLWIAFRRVRLWYWKTDIQINMLKSIDSHLKSVEEKLSRNPEKPIGMADGGVESTCCDIDSSKENDIQKSAVQVSEGLTAIGKSGRVYTEAELELQIRE